MSIISARDIDAQLRAVQDKITKLKISLRKQENVAKLPLLISHDNERIFPGKPAAKARTKAQMSKHAKGTDGGEHLLLGMYNYNKKDVIGKNT
jgi:hypothetical protein